ncbi:GGDEF domain-containing protein [Ancylobacter lacus]|uniref:GGDEF domain-containing protein n=1 Tax=Ancylobacter lacus TaxID=2579970 RepID=UPI001BCD4E32|nr:GGDEF domain-containing protein [Ancylobacter lacus]MBS7539175.1 GGDEF domain-containing protein [Ancylobacter lacus]
MDPTEFVTSLDIRTLFRLMFLADVAVCLLLLSYREEAGKAAAIRFFVMARSLHGAACLLISFRGETPLWLSPYMSNIMAFAGLALEVATVARLRRPGWLMLIIPGAIAVAGSLLFIFVARTGADFVGISSTTIGLLFTSGAVALMSAGGRSRLVWLIVAMYLAVGLFSLIRGYGGLLAGMSVDNKTAIQMSALVVSYMYCVGGGVGFLLMLKEDDDDRLRRDAMTDSLTGLLNHRAFFDAARDRLGQTVLSEQPISMLFLDLDHFKAVNDTYGHQAGDEVLRGVTAAIAANLDANSLLGRVGGEEFAVLLSGGPAEAQTAAERLRGAVTTVRLADHPQFSCTVSIGGTVSAPHMEKDLQAIVRRCDLALYEAKRAGRDQAIFH